MMTNTILVSCIILLTTTGYTKAVGGGSCWAAPFVFGPACKSDTAVFPASGATSKFTIGYSVTVNGNIPTQLCCNAKGFNPKTNKEQWTSIGCGYNTFKGTVIWGNNAALPGIKCKGTPTGAFFKWSH